LSIKPQSADLKRDTDWFDKMDPYVVIQFGTQKWTSDICQEGGKRPKWYYYFY